MSEQEAAPNTQISTEVANEEPETNNSGASEAVQAVPVLEEKPVQQHIETPRLDVDIGENAEHATPVVEKKAKRIKGVKYHDFEKESHQPDGGASVTKQLRVSNEDEPKERIDPLTVPNLKKEFLTHKDIAKLVPYLKEITEVEPEFKTRKKKKKGKGKQVVEEYVSKKAARKAKRINIAKMKKRKKFLPASIYNKEHFSTRKIRFRAVRFAEFGQLEFFEKVRFIVAPSGDEIESENIVIEGSDLIQELADSADLRSQLEVSKGYAIRNWVLNSPFPYKPHGRFHRWKQATNSQENVYIPPEAEETVRNQSDLLPFDFVSITDLLKIELSQPSNDRRNTAQLDEGNPVALTMLSISTQGSNKSARRVPGTQQSRAFNSTLPPIQEVVDGKDVRKPAARQAAGEDTGPTVETIGSAVSKGSAAGLFKAFKLKRTTRTKKLPLPATGAINVNSIPAEEVVEGGFNYWLPVYSSNNEGMVADDLVFLDRMFPFWSDENEENSTMVTFKGKKGNQGQLWNTNSYNDPNHDLQAIEVGDMFLTAYYETLQTMDLQTQKVDEVFNDVVRNPEDVPPFIQALHHQYGSSRRSQNSNFCKIERYTAFNQAIKRNYLLHTLNDFWTLPNGYKAQARKRGPVGPRRYFSERGISIYDVYQVGCESLFGSDSPLYFKDNVTYVLLYDKSDGVNKRNNVGLDVLGVITKVEYRDDVQGPGVTKFKLHKLHEKRKTVKDQHFQVIKDVENPDTRNERIAITSRRDSFSANSNYSSSDSEESILTEDDLSVLGDEEISSLLDHAKQDPQKGITAKDEIRKEAVGKRMQKKSKGSDVILSTFGQNKIPFGLLVLASGAAAFAVFLNSTLQGDNSLTITEIIELKRQQFALTGAALFCFVLGSCLFFIQLFKESHIVDSKRQFLEAAIEGKDFVIAKSNLMEEIEDDNAGLSAAEILRMRRNHRVIVLVTNLVPGMRCKYPVDTPYTASNTIGNITRIADATYKVNFKQSFNPEDTKDHNNDEVYDSVGARRAEGYEIESIQEISEKPIHVDTLVHFVHNDAITVEKIKKTNKIFTETTFDSFWGKMGFSNNLYPRLRYLGSIATIVWSIYCVHSVVFEDNKDAFYSLGLLVIPALTGCWENPIGVLLGLYYTMHYGASGGLVGKLLVKGSSNHSNQGLFMGLFSLVACAVPYGLLALQPIEEDEVPVLEFYVAIALGSLAVISTLPFTASFTRRYCLESLEVLAQSSVFLRSSMSLFYSIEWLSLRTESCLFLADISESSQLLIAELADLAHFFTSGDLKRREQDNKYGIPTGLNVRSKDAVWGLIDTKTKGEVFISPLDPGFKSIYFQASGISVFAASYYANNFYRSSFVGKKTDPKEPDPTDAQNQAKEQPKKPKRIVYRPRRSSIILVFLWHLISVLGILFENLLYLPFFVLYLMFYIISGVVVGALIIPVALSYAWAERSLSSEELEKEPPNSLFLKIMAFYNILVLIGHSLFTFWVKLGITSMLATIKILLAMLFCRKIQYFSTPRVPLYFLPALTVTDYDTKGKQRRKRLFKRGDGGAWFGEVPYFAELPLYPKTQSLNLTAVSIRQKGDCVVRGKVRSNRNQIVGFVDKEHLNQVGLSR